MLNEIDMSLPRHADLAAIAESFGAPAVRGDAQLATELRRLGRRLAALADSLEPSPASAAEPEDDSSSTRPDVTEQDRQLAAVAEALYRARGKLAGLLPAALIADPGSDMLLDLFVQRARGRAVCLTSLGAAGRVPPSTGLRWIGLLQKHELIEIYRSEHDRRTRYVTLTESGVTAMRAMLAFTKAQMNSLA